MYIQTDRHTYIHANVHNLNDAVNMIQCLSRLQLKLTAREAPGPALSI